MHLIWPSQRTHAQSLRLTQNQTEDICQHGTNIGTFKRVMIMLPSFRTDGVSSIFCTWHWGVPLSPMQLSQYLYALCLQRVVRDSQGQSTFFTKLQPCKRCFQNRLACQCPDDVYNQYWVDHNVSEHPVPLGHFLICCPQDLCYAEFHSGKRALLHVQSTRNSSLYVCVCSTPRCLTTIFTSPCFLTSANVGC